MSTQPHQADDTPRADLPAKSGIVWIASFPKSGNTWVRTFLHNLAKLQSGEEAGQDINEMNRFSTWDIDPDLYAGVLGLRPDNKAQRKEIAAARHKVQERIADQVEGLVFVKTHSAMVFDRGYSTINFAVTAGAIYIVRNPLDVAISYAHHMGRPIDRAIGEMSIDDVETPGSDEQIYEVFGSWSQHVFSWTRKPHPALHVMRYEDMLDDPEKTFGGLARHLRLEPTPEQLAQAIELSSFDKLQAQEKQKGFRERPRISDQSFFREGRAGQWKEVLTEDQVQRIVDAHAEQMQRFGYLPLS